MTHSITDIHIYHDGSYGFECAWGTSEFESLATIVDHIEQEALQTLDRLNQTLLDLNQITESLLPTRR